MFFKFERKESPAVASIKIELSKSRDITIPLREANLLMDSGNGNAALLYIYILSHGEELDIQAAAERLSLSSDNVLSALKVLEERGIIGKTEKSHIPDRGNDVPEFSETDVASFIGSDAEFKSLYDFTQRTLGKMLSTVDVKVLLGIYSWLGLPPDVICLLIASSVQETKKKYGPGRIPTMKAIEKRAKIWASEGVMTLGRAEEYLREHEKLGSRKGRVAEILRISGRALSPTEDRYISDWISRNISEELIAEAYDKTVVSTGKLSWNYMNKILMSWQNHGFTTIAEVKGEAKAQPSANVSSGDESAAMRLRELNRKKRLRSETGEV